MHARVRLPCFSGLPRPFATVAAAALLTFAPEARAQPVCRAADVNPATFAIPARPDGQANFLRMALAANPYPL